MFRISRSVMLSPFAVPCTGALPLSPAPCSRRTTGAPSQGSTACSATGDPCHSLRTRNARSHQHSGHTTHAAASQRPRLFVLARAVDEHTLAEVLVRRALCTHGMRHSAFDAIDQTARIPHVLQR